MSYYFLANIKINSETLYKKYIDRTDSIFKKFNGKYLAVDNNPEILEGIWNYSRIVIIEFESKSDFETWYRSAEYQEILKYRLNASVCDTILAKGLD